jgi:hypothetical protein
MPAVAPEDPEQEKATLTEKEITGITPGDEQSSDPKKRIYTGSVKDPRASMWSDPLLKLDTATRIWAEESHKQIAYLTGAIDPENLKRWAADVQHVVSFKLANLSVDRDIPFWAIYRDPYRIIEFLYFLYPELETNPTQKRKAALAFEVINLRWRMHDPSEESPLCNMSAESIRKWEERLRRGGNEFWEMSERGKALRWKHFDRAVKRAFGVETITEDIYDSSVVQLFISKLDLDGFELIKTATSCDFCHADTGETPWNCRTFRFNTFGASWGLVGKGGTTFRAGIVYTCNDCASDIEEGDRGSIVDRAAANLRIEFKQEINRPTIAEIVEKFIENRIK